MAEKISTLEIKVDLGCRYCYKKIQKTLCKLQERENIKTISYDKKNNTVTISGPFDPEKLSKKLRCMACKVIIAIIIVVEKPKPKPPAPPPPPPVPCKCCCKVCNNIKIISCDHHKDPKCTVTKKVIKDPTPEKEKDDKDKKTTEKETKKKVINDIEIIICEHPKCPDSCTEPPKKIKCPPPCEPPCQPPCPPPCPPSCPPPCEPPCPPTCEPPCPPPCPPPCQPPICQVCCWMPSSGGYQGGSRCYSCGRIYGCAPDCPPMPYGGTSYGGYQFILKEDPSASCTIM
ncbi:protein PYRICULARIA ORYZAE RESISTANCE 21-like [Phoenix dactylifera]|uniref:Protein PYRICULARIA ORYZAE RESISTANCE 21-like n=1 Tax=Phoenix dactylifera TaxID=42345 RepID=A0A8B8ZUI8_PHODC|nr:protein PYRICULARIA ORYZAE RESISTANCE 21-like [Phoenix dactylifera]